MQLKKQFATRFIHSELPATVPQDLALRPIGIGINAGDGSVFTSDEFSNTIPLSGARDLELEKYVGRGRPLEDDPSDSEDINSGNVSNLNDIVNHLYLHTLAYTPPSDDRRLGIVTVDAGSMLTLEPAAAPQVGTNKVTLHYLNRQTQQIEELDFFYEIVDGATNVSNLRLRFRCLAGNGDFSQVDQQMLEVPDYTPSIYDFIPESGSTWLIELVHDYGTGAKGYHDGQLVGFVRVEVMPYV